jgi:hypothetical protein
LDDNSGCILFEDDYGQNYEDEKVTSESDQETTDVTRMTIYVQGEVREQGTRGSTHQHTRRTSQRKTS